MQVWKFRSVSCEQRLNDDDNSVVDSRRMKLQEDTSSQILVQFDLDGG